VSFQSQEVGFSQLSCLLSFRVTRDVDYLLRRGRGRPRTAPTQTCPGISTHNAEK
jgi:hypothetical protein